MPVFALLVIMALFLYSFLNAAVKNGTLSRFSAVNSVQINENDCRRIINTKLVGVTFNDSQNYIKNCYSGEKLIVRHTPSESFPESISVYDARWHMLGHINAELAYDILENYPRAKLGAKVLNITGGGDELSYGCNIMLLISNEDE